MEVTTLEFHPSPYPAGKTKCLVDFTLDGRIRIVGSRIIESHKGLVLSFPARREGEMWRESIQILDPVERLDVERAVMGAYQTWQQAGRM